MKALCALELWLGALVSVACTSLVEQDLGELRCTDEGAVGEPACNSQQVCAGGRCRDCAAREVCGDRLDNDCDGRTDENCSAPFSGGAGAGPRQSTGGAGYGGPMSPGAGGNGDFPGDGGRRS